jgi:hypothetical protein
MSLFDFFFPEQAQASYLRDIAEQQTRNTIRQSQASTTLEARVKHLETDLGYVTLILGSILDKLDEKGVVTRQDLKDATSALDKVDGVRDGKLDINILRNILQGK